MVLCVNAPFSMLAQPHLISVTSAGRTEWEGRVGFAYGNVIKRVCTMGWCVLALCWLAFLLKRGSSVQPDAAFGDSVRYLLPPVLQGVMLACVLAAAMSTGDALQVTISGLISQNIYRRYIRPGADEASCVRAARLSGFAILMRESVVGSILTYFKLTATVGVSVALGILWRRMNSSGVFASTIAAAATLVVTRYILGMSQAATTGLPLAAGLVFGVVGSLMGERPEPQVIEKFFKKIYVPIGQEEKLALALDEAVPPERRLLEVGELFIVKPSRQSWVGFVVTLGVCLVLVGLMVALLL